MTWFVVRVKSPYEFAIRDALVDRMIGAMVPRRIEIGRNKRGNKSVRRVALIRHYVFAEDVDARWSEVREMRGMIGLWGTDGRAMKLKPCEIEALDALSQLEEQRSKYTAGQRLRLKAWAYAEVDALFMRLEKGKVVVDTRLGIQKLDASRVEAA